jgi:glutamate racemase
VAPEHIAIVDSAESTAQDVAHQLGLRLHIETPPSSASSEPSGVPGLKFFATDSAEKFRKMGTRFLGLPVEDVVHVDLKE